MHSVNDFLCMIFVEVDGLSKADTTEARNDE